MQTIATFGNGVPANLAKGLLEEAGIEAYLADEEMVNQAWHLSIAVGGIKLQVADEDVEQAREILAEHDRTLASGNDFSSEPDLEPPSVEDDFIPATQRETTADRALRTAIFGIFFLPIQLYVFWLLLKVYVSDERLNARSRRHAWIAATINLPLVFILLELGTGPVLRWI